MERHGFSVVHHEMALPDARLVAAPGMDPDILNHLSGQEWQEAKSWRVPYIINNKKRGW